MEAIRVQVDGITTSFRYPHFLVGRQPTFRMPPPATIYGHICSAVGRFVDPGGVEFSYVFKYDGVGDDLELLHIVSTKSGRWPSGERYPMNLEGATNPSLREILLFPSMTLYVRAKDPSLHGDLLRAFREPRYAVALGRSQDLMSYRSVETVELEEATDVYFESTLLPWSMRPRTRAGIGVTMPRFIDPEDRRRVLWSPFVVLEERIWTVSLAERNSGSAVLSPGPAEESWWTDPGSPMYRGRRRGLVWHGFTPDDTAELVFVNAPTPSVG